MRVARLADDGKKLESGASVFAARPIAKIPLNRSYYDASSVAFFSQRALTVWGTPSDAGFTMRSIWPEDFRVGGEAAARRTLTPGSSPSEALRGLMREEPRGGARSPYAVSTLWQKNGSERVWTGRAV